MDARLAWGVDGGDLVLEAGDLATDESLVTPVLVSLFSDGLAPLDPGANPLEQDRRGYWGEAAGDPYGSQVWTLARAKATAQTAARARELFAEGLAWLQRQGIAARVDVETSYRAQGVLDVRVRLYRGTARRWAALWDATLALRLTEPGLLLQVESA